MRHVFKVLRTTVAYSSPDDNHSGSPSPRNSLLDWGRRQVLSLVM
jgi:hypothetical protein